MKAFFRIYNWQINQPINIGDVTGLLYNTVGVQTVNDIIFTNLFGDISGYSKFKNSFEARHWIINTLDLSKKWSIHKL